jgi:hypothetical protein
MQVNHNSSAVFSFDSVRRLSSRPRGEDSQSGAGDFVKCATYARKSDAWPLTGTGRYLFVCLQTLK